MYQSWLVSFISRRLRVVTIFVSTRDGKSFCTPVKERFREIFERGHTLQCFPTLLVLSISLERGTRMRITFDNLECKSVSYDFSFVVVVVVIVIVFFSHISLSLSLSLSLPRALCFSRRVTRERNRIPRNFFLSPEIPRRRFNGIKKFPRCTSLRPLLPRGAGDLA